MKGKAAKSAPCPQYRHSLDTGLFLVPEIVLEFVEIKSADTERICHNICVWSILVAGSEAD